ncbi:uncharacterized protein ELE39_003194 [Cryptosporidium sp. chipmunk genotype I]|uniref:uncharacterized protein n=1 Tax=Cryptosporidium sp. chipmunk genotype I TaxID=1280935 RepID=UPI00351A0416|nr:hypothetical protein ELE39_003194 [Cryptosporidium sp. chipmunk genotype I]
MRLTNEETEEFQKSFAPVSYGHLSRQLVEHSYSEFLDLLGRCTSDPNVQEEAKTCLWEYSAEIREIFLRMLAIGSLSRIVEDINRAIQLRETLVSMRFKQRKLAFDFYPALTMVGTPSPNVTAAMDMILLKDFSQMPNLLEELVTQHGEPVIVPKMSEIQEKLIEKQLRDEFFIMYAKSGICKSRMIHFDVVKGRIMLEKKSRFSLTLISDLKQWQVIDAKITIPEILSLYTVTKEQNSSFKEILEAQIYYMFNCKGDQGIEPVQDTVKVQGKNSEEDDLDNINSEKGEVERFTRVKDYEQKVDVLGELYKTSNVITGEVILEMFLEQSILSIKERGIAGIYHSERSEYKYNNETYKYIDIYLYKNVDITNLTNFENSKGNFDFSRYSLTGNGLSNSNLGQAAAFNSILYNRDGANIILRFLMIPNGDIRCILWPFSLLFQHKSELSDDVNSVLDIIGENESWKYLCNWEKTNHNNILDLSKVLNHVSNVFRCYLLELYSLKLQKYLDKNAIIEKDEYSLTLRLLDHSEYIVSMDIFTGSLVIRDSCLGSNSIWKNYPSYYENLQKALQSNTNSLFQLLPYLLKLTKFQIVRNEFSLNCGWRPICNVPTPIQESILVERKLNMTEFPEIKDEKGSENNNKGIINNFERIISNVAKNGSSVIINTVIDNILTMTNCMVNPRQKAPYTNISRESKEFDYFFYPKNLPDNSRVIYIQLDTESCEIQTFKVFFTKNCRYTEDIDKELSLNNEIYRILGSHNFENNNKNDYHRGKVILAEFDINLSPSPLKDDNLIIPDAKYTYGGKIPKLHAPGLQVRSQLHVDESDTGCVLNYVGFDEIVMKKSLSEVFEFYSGSFETKHCEILEFLELLQESVGDYYFPFKLYSRLDRSGQFELSKPSFCMGIKEYNLFFQPFKDFEREKFLFRLKEGGLCSERIQFKIQVCKIGAGKFPILNRSNDYSGVQNQGNFFYRFILETNQDRGNLTLFTNGEIPVPLICSLNSENEALLFDENYKMEFSVCDEECKSKLNIPKEWGLINTISLVMSNNALIQEGFTSIFIDYWYRILKFLHKSLETIYMAYYSKPNYSQNVGSEMVSRRDFLIKRILPWEIELKVFPWSLLFGDSLSNMLFHKLNYKGGLIKIQLVSSSIEGDRVNQVDNEALSNIDKETSQGFNVIDFMVGGTRTGTGTGTGTASDSICGGNMSDINIELASSSNNGISANFKDSHNGLQRSEFVVVDIVDKLLTKSHIEMYKNDLRNALSTVGFGVEGRNILCKAFWRMLRSYEISISVSLIESKSYPDIQEILQKDIHGFYDSLNTLSLKRIDEIGKFLLSFGLRKVGMHIIFLFEIDPEVHYKLRITLFDVQNIQVGGNTTQQSVEVINHTKRLLVEFIRVVSCQIIDFETLSQNDMSLLSIYDLNNFKRLEHIKRNISNYQSTFNSEGEIYYYPGYFFQRIICSLSQFFTSSFYVSIASGVTQRKLNNMMAYLANNNGDCSGNGGSISQLKQPILNWLGGNIDDSNTGNNKGGANTSIKNKIKFSKFDTFPIKQPIIEFTWFYNKIASFDVDRKHILSFNKKWEKPSKYHKIPNFINFRLPSTRSKGDDKFVNSDSNSNPNSNNMEIKKDFTKESNTKDLAFENVNKAYSSVNCGLRDEVITREGKREEIGGKLLKQLDNNDGNMTEIFNWPLEYDVPFFITTNLSSNEVNMMTGGYYMTNNFKKENKRSFSDLEEKDSSSSSFDSSSGGFIANNRDLDDISYIKRKKLGIDDFQQISKVESFDSISILHKTERESIESNVNTITDIREGNLDNGQELSSMSYPVFPLVCFPDFVRSGTNKENLMVMDMSYSLELFTSPISSEFDILGQILQYFGSLSQSRTLVRIVTIALCSSLMVIRDISILLKYPLLSIQGKLPIYIDLICQYDDLLVPIEKEEKTYFLRGLLYRIWRYNKSREITNDSNLIIDDQLNSNLNKEDTKGPCYVDIYVTVRSIPVKSIEDVEINGCKASQIFKSLIQQNMSHMSILSIILDRLFNSPFEELQNLNSTNALQQLDSSNLRGVGSNKHPSKSTSNLNMSAAIGMSMNHHHQQQQQQQQQQPVLENTVGNQMSYLSSTSTSALPLTNSPLSSPVFSSNNVMSSTNFPRNVNNQSQNMNSMVSFSKNHNQVRGGQNYKSNSTGQISVSNLVNDNINYLTVPSAKQIPYSYNNSNNNSSSNNSSSSSSSASLGGGQMQHHQHHQYQQQNQQRQQNLLQLQQHQSIQQLHQQQQQQEQHQQQHQQQQHQQHLYNQRHQNQRVLGSQHIQNQMQHQNQHQHNQQHQQQQYHHNQQQQQFQHQNYGQSQLQQQQLYHQQQQNHHHQQQQQQLQQHQLLQQRSQSQNHPQQQYRQIYTQNNPSRVSQSNHFQYSSHQSRQYQQNNANEMIVNPGYNKNQEFSSFGGGVEGGGAVGVVGGTSGHSNGIGHSQHLYSGNNGSFEIGNGGIGVGNNTYSSSNIHNQHYQYSKQQQQQQQLYNQRQQNQHNQNQYQQQRYSQNQNVLHYNTSNVNIRPSHIISGVSNNLVGIGGTGGVQTAPSGNLQGGSLAGRIQTTGGRRNPTIVDNNHDQYRTQAPAEMAPAGQTGYMMQNFQGQKGGMMNNVYNGEVSSGTAGQYYGSQYHHISGHNQINMGGGLGNGVPGLGYRGGIDIQDQQNQQGQMHQGGSNVSEMRRLDYNYGNYTQ